MGGNSVDLGPFLSVILTKEVGGLSYPTAWSGMPTGTAQTGEGDGAIRSSASAETASSVEHDDPRAGGDRVSGWVPCLAALRDRKRQHTFRSVLASNLLQGVAIATGAIVIGWLVGRSADRQANRLELDRKRLELLQRMRAAHVSIAHAQRLIMAEDDDTYKQQMRALMLVARDLEEIREDVKVTEGLYAGKDRRSIMKGIAKIIEFLEAGNREYVGWRNSEGSQSERDYRRLEWVADLIKPRGRPSGSSEDPYDENWAPPDRMPDDYEKGLDLSKANMRAYVYGELKPSHVTPTRRKSPGVLKRRQRRS